MDATFVSRATWEKVLAAALLMITAATSSEILI